MTYSNPFTVHQVQPPEYSEFYFRVMYILYVWCEKSLIISVNIFENSFIVIDNFILDSFLDAAGTYHSGFFSGSQR